MHLPAETDTVEEKTKMNSKTTELKNGAVTVIDGGKLRIHVYNTKDAIDDQVIVVEKPHIIRKGGKGVVIELPCFKDSIAEMTQYLEDQGIEVEGKMVSYHAAGDSFLPDVKAYMTESAHKYNTVGGGRGLITNFTGAFGDAFDSTVTEDGERIGAGKLSIAGIDMVINPDSDAYEVEIPEMKAVYMHMLGHDCHSIVAGAGHADAIIANLKGYLDRGFEIFLSAHYGPETREDVETKIAYLENLKSIASGCSSAEEFKQKVNEACPGYSGANYLDMTAGFFFPQ